MATYQLRHVQASDKDAVRAAIDAGFRQYAQSKTADGELVYHYQGVSAPSGTKSPSSAEDSLGLGARAEKALADAGHTTAAAWLLLSDDDLAATPGVGPATIEKIKNLR